MCSSCNDVYKIFSVEIVTQEPVTTNMDLYKEIAHRLFQNKVISNINIGNNRAYSVDGRQIFGFDLHLANTHNALLVTLANTENALSNLLDQFDGYSDLTITAH